MTAIALAPSALIPAGVLCHALKLFNKVVEKRNTLPIFGNVALASGPSGVTLTGTDLDIALVASLPGALADDGLAVTMNQSLLYDLARKATCPDIGVSDNAGTAAIDMAGSTATLQTLPFTDWPHLPFTGEINADFQMLASDLQDRTLVIGIDRCHRLCHLDRENPLLPQWRLFPRAGRQP